MLELRFYQMNNVAGKILGRVREHRTVRTPEFSGSKIELEAVRKSAGPIFFAKFIFNPYKEKV